MGCLRIVKGKKHTKGRKVKTFGKKASKRGSQAKKSRKRY